MKPGTESMPDKTEERGGSGRGQGRRVERGFGKLVALRFLSPEEELKVMAMTPRERVEACLAKLDAVPKSGVEK